MSATSDLIARNFARDYQERIEHLAAIWNEEAPHNDFRGMARQFHRMMPRGLTFLRLQPRPFGITYKVGNDTYQITCSDIDYTWSKVEPIAEAA